MRLLQPGIVGALVATVAGAFYTLLPDSRGLEALADREHRDQVSVAYLRALLDEHPEDAELRLRLARAERATDHRERALAVLTPLEEAVGAPGEEARLLRLQLERDRWRALDAADPERTYLRQTLLDLLGREAARATAARHGETLAEVALELDAPALAAELYLQRAEADLPRRAEWMALGARWLLAARKLDQAGEAYVRAAEAATGAEALRHAKEALVVLVGASDGAAALRYAGRILERFPGRRELLDAAVLLARTRGDAVRAQEWMRQRALLDPADPAVLQRQLEVELAASDPRAGLNAALRLAALHPEDAAAHRAVARVAEWANAPAAALPEWEWLAAHGGDPDAPLHAQRLAEALRDGRTAARMLALRARRGQLAGQELSALIAAFEAIGRPEQAEALIRAQLERTPADRTVGVLLAELQERQGRLDAALATWRRVPTACPPPEPRRADRGSPRPVPGGMSVRAASDGDSDGATAAQPAPAADTPAVPCANAVTPDQLAHQAELLWRLGRPAAALETLRAARAQVPPDATAFWSLYAQLAWVLEVEDEALLAQRRLAPVERGDLSGTQRLLRLAVDTRDAALAQATARAGWRRFADPNLLLLGMEAAAQRNDLPGLRELCALAAAQPQPFAARARYWALQGQLAEREGRWADALAAALRAHDLDPRAFSGRIAILSVLARAPESGRLQPYLDAWGRDAEQDPRYWRPLAGALTAAGRDADALPWFERILAANPRAPDAYFEYALALDRLARFEDARQLRERALAGLAPAALAALGGTSDRAGDVQTLLSYAELLDRARGPLAAAPFAEPLLARAPDHPEVQDFAIRWSLARGDLVQAKAWMERKRAAGRTLPAWQRLAVAQAEHDGRALAAFADDPPGDLSVPDRISAQRALGRDHDAWRTAAAGRSAHPQLRAQLDQLDQRFADELSAAGGISELGALRITHLEAQGRTARLFKGTLKVRVQHDDFTSASAAPFSPGTASDPSARETRGALVAALGPERQRTQLVVGARLHAERAVPFAQLSQGFELGSRVSGRVELAFAERPDETAALLLGASRHRATGALQVDLGAQYVVVTAGARLYQRLDGGGLGQGAGLELEAGHRVRFGLFEGALRVTGAYQVNGVSDAQLLSRASSAGLGVTLANGDPFEAVGPAVPVRLSADAWGGWLFDAQRFGYSVRVGVGVPLFKRSQLSAGVTLASALDAAPGRGVELRFVHRFGEAR